MPLRSSTLSRCLALLLILAPTACTGLLATPAAPPAPTPFPQAPTTPTFPAPPTPTASIELALPAPLPTPGGPVMAYPSLNGVTDLAFAPDGSLWASTYEGGVRWDLVDDSYQPIGTADGLPAAGMLSLAFAPDGTLWAGTQSGVARYDGAAWTAHPLASGQVDDLVYEVAVAADGTVWAGTSRGASAFDGQAWRRYTTADGLADDLVWQVAPAPDSAVWFSTHGGGVSRFEPAVGRWTTFSAPGSFPQPNARMLAIGPDGAPWVHIGYDSVYRFDGQRWEMTYPADDGQWVCDMAFAADGTPWIATCGGFHAQGGGLVHWDGDQWQTIMAQDGLVSNDLTALALRSDGVIAVGSRQGIGVWQDGHWRTLRAGPTQVPVTGAAVTSDGVAWFAFGDDSWQAAGGGLASFDGQTWRYVVSVDGLPTSDNVRALQTAPDGSLWATGGCALARLGDGVWEQKVACDQIAGNIRHLAFAPDGAVWFATEWTVFRTDGMELSRHEQQHPLTLAVDAEGTAWVSHNPVLGGGWLSTFDGQTWQPVTDTLGVGVVTNLVATPDGGIWASGAAGVARLAGPGGARLYTTADGLPEDGVVDLAVGPDGALWAADFAAVARLDGDRWTAHALGIPNAQIKTIAPSADRVWLAGDRGVFSLAIPLR